PDAWLDMTANSANPQGWGPRRAVMRPGSDPKTFSSIAKVDLSTGRIERIHTQPAPGNGSALVTAGDLLFWGDLNRRFRAFDADSGKILWETVLGGAIQMSTITYAVNGRQYVAVMTGETQSASTNAFSTLRRAAQAPLRGRIRRGGFEESASIAVLIDIGVERPAREFLVPGEPDIARACELGQQLVEHGRD